MRRKSPTTAPVTPRPRTRPGCLPLEDRVNPGAGAFHTGLFDFAVSLRFDATPAQVAQVESVIQAASDVLADATDGQHRFGTVTLMSGSTGGEAAEFWVYPGSGQPSAPGDKYHVRGYHGDLFFDTNFTARQGADGDAYTFAHEFAHLAYGLEDEYTGPNGPAHSFPLDADGPGLSYSLMDNFFAHGGRATGTTYTMNEFSTRLTYDRSGDTWQAFLNGKSDWDTIAASRFPATPPADGRVVEAPPPEVPVQFQTSTGQLQSLLTIDHSLSMGPPSTPVDKYGHSRLYYAKHGAEAYNDFTAAGNGIGVISFAKDVTVVQPLIPRTTANRQAVSDAIDGIVIGKNQPAGTNLEGGILTALDQIKSQPVRTGNEVIVVLTDGMSVPYTPPTDYIPALTAAGVAVYAIGTGDIPAKGQSDLNEVATATGGRYFHVPSPIDAQTVLLRLSQELEGNGEIAESKQGVLTAGKPVVTPVPVEAGATSVLFTATRGNTADAVAFAVTAPSGATYTPASSGPGVEVISDPKNDNQVSIRLSGAALETGVWRMSASSAATTAGPVQTFAFADDPGTVVQVGIVGATVSAPAPMVIRATPQYQGLPITGAAVTYTVTGPNGTDPTTYTLYDDGLPEHGDLIAGDGIYSGLYTGYDATGSYTINVSVDGTKARAAEGEAGLFPGVAPADVAVPAFTRVAAAGVFVDNYDPTAARTDVAVALDGPTDRLIAGDTATYTVRVTNRGTATAAGVQADLHLPGGLAVVAVNSADGTAAPLADTVRLTLPTLAAGDTDTMDVTVTAVATDAYYVWADAQTTVSYDPDWSDNRASLVPPAETRPGLSAIPDGTIPAGGTLGPVTFAVADAESPATALTVTAASSDPAVIPPDGIVLDGTGPTRTVTITAGGQVGTATVTVTATDPQGLTFSRTFTVTVTAPPVPPNTPPTISAPTALTVATGGPFGPVPFTVGDAETPPDQLTVTAATSNPNLIPAAGIVIGGAGANRTLTLTPAAGQKGSVVITLTVLDAGGGLTSALITVTIDTPVGTPGNTPPTIARLADRTVPAGSSLDPIPLTVGDAETPPDQLRVTATSSNPALVPDAGLAVTGTGATRTLTVSLARGLTGSATITVTVTDGGGMATTASFTVTVGSGPNPGPSPGSAAPAVLVGYRQFAAGADRGGSPTVTAYNQDQSTRYTVPVFDPSFTGGVRTAAADFNGDGVADIVVGTGPGGASHVRILDGVDQHELFALDPFEASFTGGVYVAAGDVTGDGIPDLIVTPDEGGGPRVRVFSGAGFGLVIDFYGIDDPNFRGGARAAVGDVNADGVGDLIVAAGFQGGPRVAGFDGKSLATGTPVKIFGDFFAFEQTLRNGVFLTVGDVNGDGYADVVAGGGPGGGPRVTVFDGRSLLAGQSNTVADFFAGDPGNRGGIRVAVKDLDGDTRADLLVGSGSGAGSAVTAYTGKSLAGGNPTAAFDFDAFPGFSGGVFVG